VILLALLVLAKSSVVFPLFESLPAMIGSQSQPQSGIIDNVEIMSSQKKNESKYYSFAKLATIISTVKQIIPSSVIAKNVSSAPFGKYNILKSSKYKA